jgi:hypothetical protein
MNTDTQTEIISYLLTRIDINAVEDTSTYANKHIHDDITYKVLGGFYDTIKQAHTYASSVIHDNKFERSKVNLREMYKIGLLYSDFIPKHIRNDIIHESTNLVRYTFKVSGKNVCVYFNDGEDGVNIKKLQLIISLLKFLSTYTLNGCAKTIHLYMFLTNDIKTLPHIRGSILKTTNVNSAVTISCINNDDVGEAVIYRKEEWFKVLTHELFHLLGLDFSNTNIDFDVGYGYGSGPKYNSIQKEMHAHFGVASKYLLYEAYAEIWATLINAMFYVYNNVELERNTHFKSLQYQFGAYVKSVISIEQRFALMQLIKVLDHFDISYTNLFETNKTNKAYNTKRKRVNSNTYKESTNAFAYYIIKAILLYDLPQFLKWCRENNKNILQFNNIDSNKKNKDAILSFVNLIKKLSLSVSLHKSLAIAQKNIQVDKETYAPDHILRSSMRMTIFDVCMDLDTNVGIEI